VGGKIGQCKLCLRQNVELRKSHIVPSWAYARVLSDQAKPAHPVYVRDGIASVTSEQVWERMLCEACERLFGGWESYASRMVVQEDGSFPWIKGCTGGLVVTGGEEMALLDASSLETHKLWLFALSVIWRASVGREVSLEISLGAREERLRSYLLGEATLPHNLHLNAILLAPPANSNLPSADRFVTFPKASPEGSFERYWFCVCGVEFHLYIDDGLPGHIRRLCFIDTGLVVVMPCDLAVEGFGRAVSASHAKAALARMHTGTTLAPGPMTSGADPLNERLGTGDSLHIR
jgi:hypothetical protein